MLRDRCHIERILKITAVFIVKSGNIFDRKRLFRESIRNLWGNLLGVSPLRSATQNRCVCTEKLNPDRIAPL